LYRPTLGAHPASYSIGTGVKRPRREADQSPPTSAEVKKKVGLYMHSPYVFWCSWLVKHRDNFTITLVRVKNAEE
jgi:hypothetical protein